MRNAVSTVQALSSALILGLKDLFLWDSGDILNEHDTPIIQERLTALARYLDIDTIFGFDPSCPREAHPDQTVVGKATFWTAYFCAFPLHYPHQMDIGLKPCRITDQCYFAYYPEGPNLETLDITRTLAHRWEGDAR